MSDQFSTVPHNVQRPKQRTPEQTQGVPLYICPSDRAARGWQQRLLLQSESADCVPAEPWLAGLWSRARLFGLIDDARELIDPPAFSALWHQIVSEVSTLVAPECVRVAGLAEDAWMLAVRHGFPMQRIADLASGDDNIALFATCAARVRLGLQQRNALTRAELPAALFAHRRALLSLLPRRIALTPSFSADPALQKLWGGLSDLGITVETLRLDTKQRTDPAVIACHDQAQEMAAALDWAQAQLTAHGNGVVALVVPDLAMRRNAWSRALRERFNANSWWCDPATDRDHFNISVGDSVDAIPHLASLLTLIRASTVEQDTEVLTQALLHPRWGRSPKSQHEIEQRQRDLLECGINRSKLSDWEGLSTLATISSLTASHRRKSGKLQRSEHRKHMQALTEALTESHWLARTDLFQFEEAWAALLDRWQQFDLWLAPLSWADALAELSRLAAQTAFQPKAGTARLQVMGLLESAGVPLDAARIVGLNDAVLPERLKPHPMLPRGWQIAQRVGLGSTEEVDARAARLWQNWLGLCRTLSVSFAADNEGAAMRLSPLARHLPVCVDVAQPSSDDGFIASTLLRDEQASPTNHTDKGKPLSARTLEDQAQCPRRAAAARLGLKEWPEHAVGIPSRVRGTLVHAVLAAVGSARMQAHATNAQLPSDVQLRDVALEALETCIIEQSALRPRIALMVWQVERTRISTLVDKVLRLEQTRSGFSVVAVEAESKARLFDQDFSLRIDRVDRSITNASDSAMRVVLDYKTGKVTRSDWFAEGTSNRLAAPQLPLYALILSGDGTDTPVRAIGYIVVGDDEEPKFVGVGEDAAMASARNAKNDASWDALSSGWHEQLAQLVSEVQTGVADVAPLKGRSTCRNCAYGSFCREPWSLSSEQGDGMDTDAQSSEASNE